MALTVVPAIIPETREAVRTAAQRLGFSLELHLDVVDGVFVPFTSWPYTPTGDPVDVKEDTDRFTLEVDLMVEKPLLAAERWVAAGADMLVFHVETIELSAFMQYAAASNLTIGVSAHMDTPDEVLFPYLATADYVQVMGIANIGAQGQPFDERALTRIAAIAANFPKLLISVDGSVNAETLPRLKAAGASRFIAGSAVVKAEDPAAAHFRLAQLA
jgi:ribulose-phosphate 3-epimerase